MKNLFNEYLHANSAALIFQLVLLASCIVLLVMVLVRNKKPSKESYNKLPATLVFCARLGLAFSLVFSLILTIGLLNQMSCSSDEAAVKISVFFYALKIPLLVIVLGLLSYFLKLPLILLETNETTES